MATSYDCGAEEEEEDDIFDESMTATPAHHHSIHSLLYPKDNLNLNHHSSYSSTPFTLSRTSSISSDTSLFGFYESDDDSVKNDVCSSEESSRRRISKRKLNARFPPPISCIGVNGKPLVSLQKIRQDGRFILVEVMTPCQDLIHARRENGCLKLHFMHSESESESEEKEISDDGAMEEIGGE